MLHFASIATFCDVTGQEICRICLNFTVLAQLACSNEQMVGGLLTNNKK